MSSSRAERSLAEKEPSRRDPFQGDHGVSQKAEERIGGEEKHVQRRNGVALVANAKPCFLDGIIAFARSLDGKM